MANNGVSGELTYFAGLLSDRPGQDPPAHPHGTALGVANREQHAAFEAVVKAPAAGRPGQQADRLQRPCPLRAAADLLEDPVAIRGRKAEVELLDALRRDAAVEEIFSCRLGLGRFQQALVILPLGPGHCLVERSLVCRRQARRLAFAGFAMRLFQGNAGAIGQHGQRLGKLDALHLHHEAEDIAADVADPALERLPLRVDLKAGVRIVVPWAEADEIAALAAELDYSAHQIDDVDRLSDLFFGIERRSHRRRQLQHATTSEFHFACSPVSLPEASCPRWHS